MNFIRFQAISLALWEPLGVIFMVALGVLALRIVFGDARKKIWAWLLLAGTAYAWLWRRAVHAQGGRYHNIFLFIGLFAIIGFWNQLPLPRRGKQLLFGVLLLVCIGRDLMFHPEEREILQVFHQLEQDSRQFSRKIGFAYDFSAERDQYYTNFAVFRTERQAPLAALLKNLKDNLAVYDGDFDAVYLFFEAKQEEFPLLPALAALAPPEQMTRVAEYYLDRHHKKKRSIWRYRPSSARNLSGGGELISNGDFSQLAAERVRQSVWKGPGKRMVRLRTENFELPDGWSFYHGQPEKTNSFITRVKRNGHFALRLETDGYLAAISPPVSAKTEALLSFTVYAEKASVLQVARGGDGIGMIPVLLLPLPAGGERRYEIKLPPYAAPDQNEIWFWLDSGTVELSDVRLKQNAVSAEKH